MAVTYSGGTSYTELRGTANASVTATPASVTFSGTAIGLSGGIHPTPYPYDAYVIYSGSNLAVDMNNRLVSGTITSVTSNANASFSGLNISAAAIGAAEASANPSKAIWDVLTSGDDQFYLHTSGSFYGPVGNSVTAGTGNDLIYTSGEGADHFYGGSGANTIVAAGGNDFIVAGDLGAATPTNASLWSYVDGGTGNDTLYAGYGANTNLLGGDGNDIIIDGLGTDYLNGGAGNDYLAAGSGVNVFNFDIDSIIGSQYDAIDYFTATTNYISLPAVYEGAFAFTQYGADTLISLSTYYIFVLNTPVSAVVSHTYYD
jgi:Ca2+-binding RTX toxin-like protein